MRLPKFAEPSQYIRFQGATLEFPLLNRTDEENKDPVFIRLKNREAPLKYPFRFGALAPGARSSTQTFGDLEMDPKHIAQVFVGVSHGGRLRLFHPADQRLLRWDQNVADIQEDDTGNIEWEDSPIEYPQHEFWIAPTENFVPAFDVQNVLNDVRPPRSLNHQVMFVAAMFQFDFVSPLGKEADLFDKLKKFQIPSKFVTFGGVV